MRNFLKAILLAHVLCISLRADVTTYPDPPNAVTSSVFSITVDGVPVTVMQYMDYHYAHFAFDGTVSVTVSASERITSHTISPLSLGIEGELNEESELTFSMDQVSGEESTPQYLVLQINALEKLVILGDPPEVDVPAETGSGIFNVVVDYGADSTGATYTQPALQSAVDAASDFGTPEQPGIVYVPAGLYKVRANLQLRSNVDFYLAPGAVLKADEDIGNYTVSGGTISPLLTMNSVENVTIRGRGEVDASGVALMNLLSRSPPVFVQQSNDHPRRRIIRTNNTIGFSRNVVIEGVLCKDASGWSIELMRTLGVRVQNVKVLNHKDIQWKIENDGINVVSSSDAFVNQCFVMTIDDAMCSKARYRTVGSMDNVLFANSVVWTWAAGVKAGMQNDHPMNNVVFRNIDIVHCRRAVGLDAKTSQDFGQTIPIEGVLFDRIRVDEIRNTWSHSIYDAVEYILEDAPINDITIRNLTLPVKRPIRCGPNYPANGLTFVNLVMGSELITDVSQVTLAGSQPIHNLTFLTTLASAILEGPSTHTNTSFQVMVVFNSPVTGLVAEDFIVTGGDAVALSGGPSEFTLTVMPTSSGPVSIHLPEGVAKDQDSMDNLASNTVIVPRAASMIPLPEVGSGALYLRLAADDLELADGAAVTNWTDSVAGRTFTGTATFDADYANGHPGVRFNGTSDLLGITDLVGGPSVGQASLFIVGNFATTGNDSISDYLVSAQYPSGSSNNRFRILKRANDGRIEARAGSGSTFASVLADTQVRVYGLIAGRTPGAVSLVMDGNEIGSGSSGTAAPMQALFLGAYGNSATQFFDGTIAEVLLYDRGLSATDSVIVQDYLTRKYFGYALDSDGDGLPDAWEMSWFGNLTSSSGGSDNFDGGPLTDKQAWLAGTDPTDGSFFRGRISNLTSEAAEVSFESVPERRYMLETSTDLNQWAMSESLGPVTAHGTRTFMFNLSTDEEARFFRIRVSLD